MTTKPSNNEAASPSGNVTWAGIFHLIVVYTVWSSTYLAIRIGVREGSGFPPFTMGLMRVAVAGGILLLWAKLMGKRLRPTRAEFTTLFISGLLLWLGGNGMVMWAEQRVDSGYTSLLIASMPMWVALMESILDRRWPSRTLVLSLVIGFGGIILLTAPVLEAGGQSDLIPVIGLLLASLSWGAGTILQQRKPVSLSPQVSSGYQQIFGALGFAVIVLLVGEPRPNPTPEAWMALGYLIVFGSLLAFTSFVSALRLLPISIVMTYAYVNPVLAVFLGWLILSEPITGWTLGGAALVLLGVAGVFRDRYLRNSKDTPELNEENT